MTHISTRTLKIISSLCDDIQVNSGTVGLLGYPGDGKTFCLNLCIIGQPNRILIRLGKSFKPINVYSEILQQMNVRLGAGRPDIYEIIRAIARSINSSEERYLIAIDESGKASNSMLEYFHELRDLTYGKCGFIFSGPHYFQKNLIAWINFPGILEFSSRIDEWVEIDHPTKSEMSEYCKTQGVIEIKDIHIIVKKCTTWRDLIAAVKSFNKGRKK